MNPQKDAYRILCYGDSNTWGKIPGTKHERFSSDIRWTGVLQKNLGIDYEIIEEGLKSRTIDIGDPDPEKPGRNGRTWLMPCLETHNPVDLVILMLGTNDLKAKYGRTPEQVADSLHHLYREIEKFALKISIKIPQVILVAPPKVLITKKRMELYKGADSKSEKLPELFKSVSAHYSYSSYVNIADKITSSHLDGVHWEESSHNMVAKILESSIISLHHKFC